MSTALATLSVATLGVPAMLFAGLAASPHCALMCGALYARAGGAIDVGGQLGRLVAYAVLGAVAGGAGEWMLRAAAWTGTGDAVRFALLPVAVWLLLRTRPSGAALRPCCAGTASRMPAAAWARRAGRGFAAGLLPCPLVLGAAGYAMLAGGALAGATLLLSFGIGTTPMVQAGAWIWARGARASARGRGLMAAASAVALVGVSGAPDLAGWCIG